MNAFYHTLQGQTYDDVDVQSFWMDGTITGIGNGNPGFPVAAKATHVYMHWGFFSEIDPGDWTFRLRQSEGTTDLATFAMPVPNPAPPLDLIRLAGPWSVEVPFAAGDGYYVFADGPKKHFILARAVLRFEEL